MIKLPEHFKDLSLLPEGKFVDDFIVTLGITFRNDTVFFLEIKPPGHVNHLSTRIAANKQMRERFRSLEPITPAPRLHGISVMVQGLAFYRMDKYSGCVVPELPTSGDFPIDWRELDITTEPGIES
ncbi:hypothetical protein EDB19DRAFT_1704660 [Suillus lakei]|nr:hypothetical protein EDB19DRAFT_1704660 [Suillus lakei]